jgi:3',5'-cyclic AMP phosphodiesterase CpdA
VHFGQTDHKKEQPRITEQLVKDAQQFARESNVVPDILVFSGDLTQRGTLDELKLGEAWLGKLRAPWPNCRLFVVPGNHEVYRPEGEEDQEKAIYSLRSAFHDEDAYKRSVKQKNNNGDELGLLRDFFGWHSDAAKRIGLVSDWSRSPLACRSSLSIDGILVHLTALFSWGGDDDREAGR